MYSASQDSVAWFQLYLDGWQQFVKIGHITSKAKICHLARGSAGINPWSSFISPTCEWYAFTFEQLYHWYIYACNTTLPLSANWNNITSLTKALSNDLENIKKWSTENTMYINTEETKALLVTGKRLQHKLCVETASLQLRHNTTNITQISHHKLQGFIINKDLSFEAHIEEFCAINCQNDLDFWGSLVLIPSKATN